MKEDIKRIINDFVVRALIYMFLGPIIMTMLRGAAGGLGLNENIVYSIWPIWAILLLLLPTMKDLKVSPLETNKKMQEGISFVDTIALAFVSWSLCYFLAIALGFITKIEIVAKVIQSIEGNLNIDSMSKYSPVLITITGLINVVTINLIFSGVLLNALRKYGDIFAIIVSATMFAMWGNSFVIPFNFIVGILAGTLYVLSNDIKTPILFSLLWYFGGQYLREYMPNLFGDGMYFYGIILIIGSIYLASRKDFRNYISLLKNQYMEEKGSNKGKYAAVFKSEAFAALVILSILTIGATLVSAFM